LPDLSRIYDAIGMTWPAADLRQIGPVTIRKGLGGGSRVSAATAPHELTKDQLCAAEDAMRVWGQKPTFMVRVGDETLDAQLASAGYVARDWTQAYLCDIATLTHQRPPPVSTFVSWPPLAAQREVWATGGIGPERLAIMDRAPQPKTSLLGRVDDQPAGTLFVGISDKIAMVHAVEVLPTHRRKGLARSLMAAAAFWASDQGARHLALLTTKANDAANPLYASLGMDVVGHYHYRQLPE